MKKWIPLLVIAVSAITIAQEDNLIHVETDNTAMNAAIKHAQASLDDFLALANSPTNGAHDFTVKVVFAPEGSEGNMNGEHLWFMPFEQTETGFRGELANAPVYLPDMKIGEIYVFSREQITDWGYQQDGKMFGNFTTCVILKSEMDEKTAQSYIDNYGFQCD